MITEEERKIFAKVGKDGGTKTRELYGQNHYKNMAKKRWDKWKKENKAVDKSDEGARVR